MAIQTLPNQIGQFSFFLTHKSLVLRFSPVAAEIRIIPWKAWKALSTLTVLVIKGEKSPSSKASPIFWFIIIIIIINHQDHQHHHHHKSIEYLSRHLSIFPSLSHLSPLSLAIELPSLKVPHGKHHTPQTSKTAGPRPYLYIKTIKVVIEQSYV